jgi:ribose 5-phosphate isomerase B
MKIAIGADHAGFAYKEEIKRFLAKKEVEVIDVGAHTLDPTDYPDLAINVARAVVNKEVDNGILICGTGIGMSIAANKVKGIRAGACQTAFCASVIKEHNDANVLCLGARSNTLEEVFAFVELFINSEFSNKERHQKRVDIIRNYEEKTYE